MAQSNTACGHGPPGWEDYCGLGHRLSSVLDTTTELNHLVSTSRSKGVVMDSSWIQQLQTDIRFGEREAGGGR